MIYVTIGELTPLKFKEASKITYRRLEPYRVVSSILANAVGSVVCNDLETLQLINKLHDSAFPDLPINPIPDILDSKDRVFSIILRSDNALDSIWSIVSDDY